MRWLQYRVSHIILGTNTLKTTYLRNDKNCSFCLLKRYVNCFKTLKHVVIHLVIDVHRWLVTCIPNSNGTKIAFVLSVSCVLMYMCFCVVLCVCFCHGALKLDTSTFKQHSFFNISSIYFTLRLSTQKHAL